METFKDRVESGRQYDLYRAMETFKDRVESGRQYSITDLTADVAHIRSGDTNPGQRFVIAIIEICNRLHQKGNDVTASWVPSLLGIGGNEGEDERAKMAPESKENKVETTCGRQGAHD